MGLLVGDDCKPIWRGSLQASGLQDLQATGHAPLGSLSFSQPGPGRLLLKGGFRPMHLTDSHSAKGFLQVFKIQKALLYPPPFKHQWSFEMVVYYVTKKRARTITVHVVNCFHIL